MQMEQIPANRSVSLHRVKSFFKKHSDYIILTHCNPDGDTLGSAYALAMILQGRGKRTSVLCSDPIPSKYSYFTGGVKNNADSKCAVVVAVDVADMKLLGDLEKEYSGKIELCIDHHVSNKFYAKQTYLDSDAAANCECIYDLAESMHLKITKQLALALYTGLSTDTGCFRFSNTTSKTLRIAANLMETGIDTAEINRIMFETKSRLRVELERMALDEMEFHFNGRCALVAVTRHMYEKTGCKDEDLEGLTSLPRTIEGVLAGITIRERADGSYKVSLRTYPPVDASAICKNLGGGGHVRAAGCQIESKYTLEQAKAQILAEVRSALEEDCAGTVTD